MTDLEHQWDDLPVGPAPVDAILRAARREEASRRPERRLRRSLLSIGAVGGIAAAFIAGTLVTQPGGVGGAGAGSVPPDGADIVPAAFRGELEAPESCDELLDHYIDQAVDLVGAYGWESPQPYFEQGGLRDQFSNGLRLGTMSLSRMPQAATAPDRATRATSEKADAGTSTVTNSETGTNVQEVGVDEPDSVKTDGSTLVRLRQSTLTTYDVTGDAVEELGRLDLGDFEDGEILLAGDTVVAIGNDGTRPSRSRYGYVYDAVIEQTRVLTIDVSDPTEPSIDHTVDYSAGSVSARQHGDDVRLVLSAGLPDLDFVQPPGNNIEKAARTTNRELVEETTLDDWLPQVSIDGGEAEQFLDCDRVAIPRADLGIGTMAVVGFSAADPEQLSSIGLGGDAPLAYESDDHLYLAATGQQSFRCFDCRVALPFAGGTDQGTTFVYDFELDGTSASYVGAGEVEGAVADRWAMDEYDGVLRLAVGPSSETGNFNSVVTLKAQRDELIEIGRLDRIGVNEDIQSVRWFDGLALIVTFRRIDPFYAIDLTDQRDPTLLGELKIPGFSDYLHPLGGMRVVGMGEGPQQPGARGGWGAQAGLFDVTNLTEPSRLDVVSYGSSSRALAGADPRQFTWLPTQRTVLTVVARGRAGYVSALRLGGGSMDNEMTQVEFGSDVTEVRLVPLPDDRVALITGEDVEFFPLD